MDICAYSFEEYLNMVKSFHGNLAPGLIIGGFMVDLAMKNLPEGEFFDAISETPVCLPDAVQILTPCTFGNGWLSVVNFGRFAVTLYEKYTGKGIRVFLDTEKLNQWPEVRDWYFRKKKKSEQNKELLLAQISEAGYGLLSMQTVQVKSIWHSKKISLILSGALPAESTSLILIPPKGLFSALGKNRLLMRRLKGLPNRFPMKNGSSRTAHPARLFLIFPIILLR
jgi:formylmethanofuran dehydrogenase subunit E